MASSSGQNRGNGTTGPDQTAVAQLVEQRIPNPQVAGSSPSRRVDDGQPRSHRAELGIYKFDQGYWVRMLTALGLAILFIAGAGWAWSELDRLRLESDRWTLTVADSEGSVKPGDSLTLIDAQHADTQLGTARVSAWKPGEPGGTLEVTGNPVDSVHTFQDTTYVKSADGSFTGRVSQVGAIPIIDPLYIKSGVAGLIALTGLVVIYWFVGANAKSVEFLIATDAEMKKVNWSTRKTILDSTWVVIAATLLIALYMFVFDVILRKLFDLVLGH